MFKQYDVVKCYHENKLYHGVVTKGGKKKIVMRIFNSNLFITGGPAAFQPSNQPIPMDEKSPMDKYNIKGYKSFMGTDGVAYTANIYKGKNLIGTVTDDCRGDGPTSLPLAGHVDVFNEFLDDCKEWILKHYNTDFEAEGIWVDWWVNERPFGTTAKHAGQEHQKNYNALGIDD